MAPGLFGNWTSGKIGTAWHGDYHMNYNTQQVFWGVFSSNHVDQNLPYVEVVENLLPMARNYAREKFGLPGAFFPHSAYPVPSQVVPYPAPPWGYEVCETPWTVQSLWWQYLYTVDKEFLERVYPIFRAATDFMVAFVKKGEDGKYHIVPTASPENWGCTVDFRLNRTASWIWPWSNSCSMPSLRPPRSLISTRASAKVGGGPQTACAVSESRGALRRGLAGRAQCATRARL